MSRVLLKKGIENYRKETSKSVDCFVSQAVYSTRCYYCRYGIQPYFGFVECRCGDIDGGIE